MANRILHKQLEQAYARGAAPAVLAYNRIDGPGSSLDLREFQQALWALPVVWRDSGDDAALSWTSHLPRTVGITIDTGTQVQALPFEPDRIGVRSVEYGTEVVGKPGEVIPTRENWLLKIIEAFGLSGVQFVLHNVRPGIQSSGLGGSATATTGVCILANELAGRPFSPSQLVSLASRTEQDLGVSLTGTQEQSNVVFGGVTDYVWFPWGLPSEPHSNYGSSIRRTLVAPDAYGEIESRMAIFHSGITRASTDVNSEWMKALGTPEGYRLHASKPAIAYGFAEALRLGRWELVLKAIRDYREVRTTLCGDYMAGAGKILGFAEARDCTAFPLGAGGGGGILIFGPNPEQVDCVRKDLCDTYREVPYRIMPKGHELMNLPMDKE
ncbi:GHMP kinase [Candidatus Sumerlaeota bacterium]|nr:GHMP kinase [Candidatus Sumerlaeota bacterium]